jgi:hypothetical protein
VLSTIENGIDHVGIYITPDSNQLKIVGLLDGETELSIFNINGQELLSTSIESTDRVNYISLPKLSTGIYIAKLNNQLGQLSKKVIINN